MQQQKWKGRRQVDVTCDCCPKSERVRGIPKAPLWYKVSTQNEIGRPVVLDVCAECYEKHVKPLVAASGNTAVQAPVTPEEALQHLSGSVTARVRPSAHRATVDANGMVESGDRVTFENSAKSVKIKIRDKDGNVVDEVEGDPASLRQMAAELNARNGGPTEHPSLAKIAEEAEESEDEEDEDLPDPMLEDEEDVLPPEEELEEKPEDTTPQTPAARRLSKAERLQAKRRLLEKLQADPELSDDAPDTEPAPASEQSED